MQEEQKIEEDGQEGGNIDWDDWESPKLRHKASSAPVYEEPQAVLPPLPAPDPINHQQHTSQLQLHTSQHHQHHQQPDHQHKAHTHQQSNQQHNSEQHSTGQHSAGGQDPLQKLKQTIHAAVEAEVGGVREAMAFTATEFFFSGPSGTRREPLSVVGPLRGTATGDMQLMLEGARAPVTVTLSDFSDQRLHVFFQQLDAAAAPLRSPSFEHDSHPQPTSPHPHHPQPSHATHPHSKHGKELRDKREGNGQGSGGGNTRDMARVLDGVIAGLVVLERVDGDGCSVALTSRELVVVHAERGTRREKLAHVLGVRNSPSGDLEIQLAGGLPIALPMASMPSAPLSKLFAAMAPLTNQQSPGPAQHGNSANAWSHDAHVSRSSSAESKAARVHVNPIDEAEWRMDHVAAAQLQTQMDAKLLAIEATPTVTLVGSKNAVVITDLQLVLIGNATGNRPEGRVLMLARVRKMVRSDEGSHEIRMVEGFTFKVSAKGFARSSQACIEALDDFMVGVAARVKGLKVPEQLALEAEEDEMEAAAVARTRHQEMKEEERVKRLADIQRRNEARKAMQGGASGGQGHTGKLPQVAPEATSLLHAAAGRVTAQIVSVLQSGHEQLFALSVSEVVWSRPGSVRREALSDIDKVVSSPEGNLLLNIKGYGKEPLPIEAAKFKMEELGAFFQFLSEFHSKAIEARLQKEEDDRKDKARRKQQEEDDLVKQGEAAVEAARLGKIEAKKQLRSTVMASVKGSIVKEVYGAACIFAVGEEEALFADSDGLQVAALRSISSVRNDPTSGALLLIIKDELGERAGLTVPADAFTMEQLGEVFGAMSTFSEGLERAARDERTRVEEERLGKEREIREAEEAEEKKREEVEAARKAEEDRLAAAAAAKKDAEEKAFKDNMANLPKVKRCEVVLHTHASSCVYVAVRDSALWKL